VLLRLLLWSLADSGTTVGELRRWLRDDGVGGAEDAQGLLFSAWVSDESTDRWGAIEIWETAETGKRSLTEQARRLIGKDADVVESFDVEATAEGHAATGEIGRRGLAFDGG